MDVKTIGFVGTGVLASSMIHGIKGSPELSRTRVVVSPRNADMASDLASRYENVTMARSNQDVLDASDWVVISVIPSVAESVVRELRFRPDHTVISVLATKRLSVVRSWISPAERLFRMVPMPFISLRTGPITLYPADDGVEEFFGHLGRVIVMDEEPQAELTNAITSVTNATYTVIKTVAEWGEKNGLPRDKSLDYTISYFEAMLSQISGDRSNRLPRLVEERTPGGMNDVVMRLIASRGGFDLWADGLDAAIKKCRADYCESAE
ncbi:MAG: NAD(P)-binding domain-containing protein [Synergistaceae bacterium]|jgi:pyrroline-5-carboxylate reductase|nr:NAD(P)-binding domain-containing protein [Synergistaceae bacterium]